MGIPYSRIPPPQPSFAHWNLLPRELRLLILSKTHLVRRHDWLWNESASPAGPNIQDGRLLLPELGDHKKETTCDRADATVSSGPCNTCLARQEMPFPIALFTVSKQMYEDACEVFWSQRFVLQGTFTETALWLRNLGEHHTSKIKKMDLVVEREQVRALAEYVLLGDDEDRFTLQHLRSLLKAIRLTCNLEKLWLSVNLEWSRDSTEHWLRVHLQRTCKVLFILMVENIQGEHRLARFQILLSWCPESEDATEKAVMGGGYDSAREGKVAFDDRNLRDLVSSRMGLQLATGS